MSYVVPLFIYPVALSLFLYFHSLENFTGEKNIVDLNLMAYVLILGKTK